MMTTITRKTGCTLGGRALVTTDYEKFAVLCVDDDRASLVAMSYALETDFRVITATSGEEALRKLAAADVAVIVVDQRMPGMRGCEVCARAREMKPNVFRMIVTAYTDINDVMDAINLGQVSRFLTKPWLEEELKAALRTAIDLFHLQRLVAEMEVRLMRNERLAGARAVTDLVEHDVRQRLGALRIGLEAVTTISNRVPDPLGSRLAEIAADGKASIDHLTTLMRRVRAGAVARADEPMDADAARVVEMAIVLTRNELERRRARCELVAECRPHVAIRTTELAQVLLNLLTNACESLPEPEALPKREPPPGDEAPAKRDPPPPRASLPEGEAVEHLVSVQLRAHEGCAVLTVRDTGRGIPPEDVARIFEEGFTTKNERDGAGLGLVIVKDLIEARRGKIEVESTRGIGTTFRVTLPVDEKEEQHEAE